MSPAFSHEASESQGREISARNFDGVKTRYALIGPGVFANLANRRGEKFSLFTPSNFLYPLCLIIEIFLPCVLRNPGVTDFFFPGVSVAIAEDPRGENF